MPLSDVYIMRVSSLCPAVSISFRISATPENKKTIFYINNLFSETGKLILHKYPP